MARDEGLEKANDDHAGYRASSCTLSPAQQTGGYAYRTSTGPRRAGVCEAVSSFSLVDRSPEGNFTGHSVFPIPDRDSADFKRARSMTKTISCAWG